VAAPDGNLYFVESGKSKIGRVTTSGVITEFAIPTAGYVEGLTAGPDGAIWFAEYQAGKIGRMSIATPETCAPDPTTLCVNGGRFRVTADWRTPEASGAGRAIALGTDSGYFWFFDMNNVEILVKVLNGCGVNSRYWVFAAGLTDVEVTLRVTDTQNGATRTYANSRGIPFQPIQDTSAFPVCP
jgi:hypothetical protein